MFLETFGGLATTGANLFALQHHTGTGSKKNHQIAPQPGELALQCPQNGQAIGNFAKCRNTKEGASTSFMLQGTEIDLPHQPSNTNVGQTFPNSAHEEVLPTISSVRSTSKLLRALVKATRRSSSWLPAMKRYYINGFFWFP